MLRSNHWFKHPTGDVVRGLHIAEGTSGTCSRVRAANICQRHIVAVNEKIYSHFVPVKEATGPCEWCLEEEYENDTD